MLLETYVKRGRGAANKDIAATLSPLEKKLAEKTELFEALGKTKRRFPIILAPFMRNAMDLIVHLRAAATNVTAWQPVPFLQSKGNVLHARMVCYQKRLCHI